MPISISSSQQRAKKVISANVRAEGKSLLSCLKEYVDERNANRKDLPEFVLRGTSLGELGQMAMHFKFEQRWPNPDVYALTLILASRVLKTLSFFGVPSTPEGHILRGVASADVRSILWEGKIYGPLTSAVIIEIALKRLADYYRRHTQK